MIENHRDCDVAEITSADDEVGGSTVGNLRYFFTREILLMYFEPVSRYLHPGPLE